MVGQRFETYKRATNDMSMASFSMEMIFFGLEVMKDSFVHSTLGFDFQEVMTC